MSKKRCNSSGGPSAIKLKYLYTTYSYSKFTNYICMYIHMHIYPCTQYTNIKQWYSHSYKLFPFRDGKKMMTQNYFEFITSPGLSSEYWTSKLDYARKSTIDYDSHTKPCDIRDTVGILNFNSGPCWVAGTVKKNIGKVMYEVSIDGKNITWCHHANQLRTRFATLPVTETTSAKNMNLYLTHFNFAWPSFNLILNWKVSSYWHCMHARLIPYLCTVGS